MTEHCQEVNIQKPRMIRLTQIGNPEMKEGVPTDLYINPLCINMISEAMGSFTSVNTGQAQTRRPCTQVMCCHFHALVKETPEEVARLREEAVGNATLNS